VTTAGRRLAVAAPLGAVVAWLLLGAGEPAGGGSEASPPPAPGHAVAIFAGGCFWCMEPPFDTVPGVVSTTSGYTGGTLARPTYEQVGSGRTGHREAVRVEYDPEQVGYAKLLEVFWHNVDPTDGGGQFCDRGEQYTTAIFVSDDAQRQLAETSKRELEESGVLGKPVVTPIRAAGPFYPAEGYHQDYYEKNPIRYKFYRSGCGRDRVLERLWGESGDH
jgi:peptide-methionine (S)-S-oxide reductase